MIHYSCSPLLTRFKAKCALMLAITAMHVVPKEIGRSKSKKKKILFLCTHNAARSQMAEGFVNSRYNDHYEAFSAGNAPTRVHLCTVKVMAEEGIDISEQHAKSLDEFHDVSFDYVVTLCADTTESCPIFPGGKTYLQRAFSNPVPTSAEERENCEPFQRVRAQIKEWLEQTFGQVV